MIRVLKAESIKIIHLRGFWIMFGSYCLLYFLTVITLSNWFETFTINGQRLAAGLINPQQGWTAIAWIGSWFTYFLGFIVIQLVCNEFEFRTNRQNVIDGYSPLEFFSGKVAIVIALTVCGSVLYLCISAFASGIYFQGEALLKFALACTGTLSLALLFAFLLQRSGQAGFLFLAFPLIVEPILNYFASSALSFDIERYLPAEAFSRLTQLPAFQTSNADTYTTAQNVLVALVVLLMLWGLAYLVYRTTDS